MCSLHVVGPSHHLQIVTKMHCPALLIGETNSHQPDGHMYVDKIHIILYSSCSSLAPHAKGGDGMLDYEELLALASKRGRSDGIQKDEVRNVHALMICTHVGIHVCMYVSM